MAANLLNKYIWLTDVIYSAGRISKKDIDRRWSMSSLNDNHESSIKRRTFINWRNSIEELFGLIIDCDRSTSLYYIANREEIAKSSTQQWLLNSFAVSTMVNESRSLQNRILLERMPSDALFLSPIIGAMRLSMKLRLTYRKFLYEQDEAPVLVAPYCIKSFKQRWYVLCYTDGKGMRVYALDRIQRLEQTDEHYVVPDDFDGDAYFTHCYGIWHEDKIPAERVRVEVSSYEAKFLRSLPLHHSQKEVSTCGDKVVFEYFISPTFDFVQELMTFGSRLRVLEPASLAAQIREEAKKTTEQYPAQ